MVNWSHNHLVGWFNQVNPCPAPGLPLWHTTTNFSQVIFSRAY